MNYSPEQIIKEKILILDGAMGTMIQRHKLGESDYRGERFRDHEKLQKKHLERLKYEVELSRQLFGVKYFWNQRQLKLVLANPVISPCCLT